VAGDLEFDQVRAHSPSHSCAVTAAGDGYCWAQKGFGELGNGSDIGSAVPEQVSGELHFDSISVGFSFTCAVTTNGAGYCWGAGQLGQVGNGELADARVPAPVGHP
jgi:alpha-tubulin suppressor-like RCC1 family protein